MRPSSARRSHCKRRLASRPATAAARSIGTQTSYHAVDRADISRLQLIHGIAHRGQIGSRQRIVFAGLAHLNLTQCARRDHRKRRLASRLGQRRGGDRSEPKRAATPSTALTSQRASARLQRAHRGCQIGFSAAHRLCWASLTSTMPSAPIATLTAEASTPARFRPS